MKEKHKFRDNLELDDYDVAVHFSEYEKAIRILNNDLQNEDLTDYEKAGIYERLGFCYVDINQEAKEYFLIALKLIEA
jgi:hypothetical protein